MRCDKCGELVELSNDAVALEFLKQHKHLPTGFGRLQYGARHLFPTATCEGSPSRAQFLGGPRDSRGYGGSLTSDQWAVYEAQLKVAYEALKGA